MWDDASGALGSSRREEPPEVDHSLWQGLWEGLASRVPHFEAVKPEGSWAGFYEYDPLSPPVAPTYKKCNTLCRYNTVDQNGIIGRHPDMSNMLLCCGFSGHGG
jgi:FAD-dependent oxidoreductase domain-containing protein 1